MEIIHLVLGKANPNRMNGVNIAVNSLASEQSTLGYNVSLWGITRNMVHDYPERPYNTILLEKHKTSASTLYNISKAIDKIRSHTVVHIHGGFIPLFFSIAYLLKRKNIPFIYTTHGAYNKIAIERSGLKKKIYFKLFEEKIISWSSVLHFVGKSESEVLKDKKIISKESFIPNGLAATIQLPEVVNALNTTELVFGFCGRITIIEKGLDLLLQAFAQYKNVHNKRGKLCLIGDGKEIVALQKMAEDLNIAPYVEFVGSIYGEEKLQIIKSFNAFVHPSRNEGMPTAVLEAAALGVPCLVSTETNLGSYINDYDAGYVLEKNTAEHLLFGLLYVEKHVNTMLWDRTKLNAKKMIVEQFQWKKIAIEHIKVYEEVLHIND